MLILGHAFCKLFFCFFLGGGGLVYVFCTVQYCAGIFEQSMWARNRVGIGLSYRPARASTYMYIMQQTLTQGRMLIIWGCVLSHYLRIGLRPMPSVSFFQRGEAGILYRAVQYCAGIFEQSKWARNRGGTGLSYTAKTKYRNLETNIPRKGIAGFQSQFPHSCLCERFIYSHDRSPYSAGGNMQTDPGTI